MMAAWDWRDIADVAELVDALDLGSSAERRGGSSPFIRTKSPDHLGLSGAAQSPLADVSSIAQFLRNRQAAAFV